MAGAREIKAGRAYVEILARDNVQRGLRSAQKKLLAFGQSMQGLGTRVGGLAAAAAAPLAMATQVFSGFSDKMSQVRAVTGATGEDFAKLTAQAKHLGATTSFSSGDVADGMIYLGMAGFKTQQILAGIPAVLNLARAGAVDLGRAADIASDVGSAFGLAADELTHIADVMAVTTANANTNIDMMGETLKYAAPIAKAAGQSLEDTATAIGIVGNSGIKASMAGTDLALIFKLMGGEAKSALKSVGVESVDAQGNIRSVLEVMKELGQATRNMTKEKRLAFFAKNFDRAGKSAIILADAGNQIDELRQKIGDADGAAARMAGVMEDNIGGAFRELESSIEGVAIAIGDAIAPMIRVWAGGLTRVAGVIQNLVENNGELLNRIAQVLAVALSAGAGLFAVGTAASVLSVAFGGLATIVGLVSSAIAGLVAFAPILALIGGAATAVYAFRSQVVGAIQAIGTWIMSFGMVRDAIGGLTSVFGELWSEAQIAFDGISDALAAGDIVAAAKMLWGLLQLEWRKGINFLNQHWIAWKAFFLDVFSNAVSSAAAVFINGWAGLQSAWLNLTGFFLDAWNTFTNGLLKGWRTASNFISKGILRLMSFFDSSIDVAAASKALDDELAGKNRAGDSARDRAIQERERERQRRLAEIEAGRTGALGELRSMTDSAQASRQSQFEKDLAESQAAVDAARREFEEAREDAAIARMQSEVNAINTAGAGGGGGAIPPNLTDAAEATSAAIGKADSVRGTFSAFAAAGLGGGSAADRTAKATEETAKNTKKLERKVEELKPKFA